MVKQVPPSFSQSAKEKKRNIRIVKLVPEYTVNVSHRVLRGMAYSCMSMFSVNYYIELFCTINLRYTELRFTVRSIYRSHTLSHAMNLIYAKNS